MGKKPLERQYLQKGREKASRRNTVPKDFSLEKAHTSKEGPKSSLSFNSKGNRSASHDINDDA
jgi:hypothetical protein